MSESSVRTTERLQRMIDAGGHVVVPPGAHVVRTLHLRSGVTLEIPADATLPALSPPRRPLCRAFAYLP